MDALGRLNTTWYLDGTSTTINYDCCGLYSQVPREGVTTFYLYDALKRQIVTRRNDTQTCRPLRRLVNGKTLSVPDFVRRVCRAR